MLYEVAIAPVLMGCCMPETPTIILPISAWQTLQRIFTNMSNISLHHFESVGIQLQLTKNSKDIPWMPFIRNSWSGTILTG